MGDSSLRQRGNNCVPSSVSRRRRWMYERSLPPSASVEDDEDEEEEDDDDVDEKAEDDEETTDSDDDNDNGLDDNKKHEYDEGETTSSDSSSVSVNNDNCNRRANCRFRSVSSRRKQSFNFHQRVDKDINDDIVMSEDKDSFVLLSGNERTGNDRSPSSSSTTLFSQMHLHSNTKSLPVTSDGPPSDNVDDDVDRLNNVDDVDEDDCLNDSCIFSIFDETNNRLVEPPMLHKQIEKVINVPIRLKDISAKIPLHKNPNYAPFMCNPMKLNLLNVHQKINDDIPQPLSDVLSQSASEFLRNKWSNVGLWFDVSNEETRVDERHCLLPLQVTLLREWCLLNLISCNDVYQVFGT